ncbi:MAG: hypothetical protein HY719_14990 [Planctomycetes bacterium]|nr:hypothetical protein [Planctomycetota bacterium]
MPGESDRDDGGGEHVSRWALWSDFLGGWYGVPRFPDCTPEEFRAALAKKITPEDTRDRVAVIERVFTELPKSDALALVYIRAMHLSLPWGEPLTTKVRAAAVAAVLPNFIRAFHGEEWLPEPPDFDPSEEGRMQTLLNACLADMVWALCNADQTADKILRAHPTAEGVIERALWAVVRGLDRADRSGAAKAIEQANTQAATVDALLLRFFNGENELGAVAFTPRVLALHYIFNDDAPLLTPALAAEMEAKAETEEKRILNGVLWSLRRWARSNNLRWPGRGNHGEKLPDDFIDDLRGEIAALSAAKISSSLKIDADGALTFAGPALGDKLRKRSLLPRDESATFLSDRPTTEQDVLSALAVKDDVETVRKVVNSIRGRDKVKNALQRHVESLCFGGMTIAEVARAEGVDPSNLAKAWAAVRRHARPLLRDA